MCADRNILPNFQFQAHIVDGARCVPMPASSGSLNAVRREWFARCPRSALRRGHHIGAIGGGMHWYGANNKSEFGARLWHNSRRLFAARICAQVLWIHGVSKPLQEVKEGLRALGSAPLRGTETAFPSRRLERHPRYASIELSGDT
jgi:hypothetical protein